MASNKMGGVDGDIDTAQQHNGGKGMGIFPPRIDMLVLRSQYFSQPTPCKAGRTEPHQKNSAVAQSYVPWPKPPLTEQPEIDLLPNVTKVGKS